MQIYYTHGGPHAPRKHARTLAHMSHTHYTDTRQHTRTYDAETARRTDLRRSADRASAQRPARAEPERYAGRGRGRGPRAGEPQPERPAREAERRVSSLLRAHTVCLDTLVSCF